MSQDRRGAVMGKPRPPGAAGGREHCLLEPLEPGSANTLTLDFWPLELGENQFLSSQVNQRVLSSYSSCRK
jgi:hypothetical protein